MAFLADIPRRSRFALDYDQYMNLPIRIRDRMAEQIIEWRAEEDRQAREANRNR